MKIDEQPDWHIQKLHIAEELSFVNGRNFLDGFEFEEQTIIDQQVKTQRFVKFNALILDRNRSLRHQV